jgi:hypothetical protein
MFKSGTSLLRAMLGQHSSIASGLETYWFDLPRPPLSTPKGAEHVARVARLLGLDVEEMLAVAREAATPEAFLQELMDSLAAAQGKARWAEKTPGNVAHMDRILAFWPSAKIIHVIRDPRDVYASHVAAGKLNGAAEFIRRWSEVMEKAERQKADIAALRDRYLEIRYEQLVQDPRAVMMSVISFLDEEWEDRLAAFEGKPEDYYRVLDITGKASVTLEHLGQRLNSDRIGLWRTAIGEEGIVELESVAGQAACGTLFKRLIEETPDIG